MSEEEAIEWAKALLQDKEKYEKYHSWVGTNTFVSIQILLNLIEKQQNTIASKEKQIKLMQSCDLAKVIKEQEKEIDQLANGIRVLGTNPDITAEEIIKEFTEKPISEEYMEEFKSRYISKDKVLKALGYEENGEEYKRIYNKEELILSLIRTINEECDRLEDIEDQKTMLEINNIESQRDKYWKDKIEKELLEPINKERQETYKEFMKKGKDDYHGVEGSVLQELNWVVGTIEELLGE